MVRRIAISVFLVLVLVGAAVAQDWAGRGMLRGIVKDKATGEVIEGATVLIYLGEEGNGPDEPLITNKKGRFKTVGLKPTSWRIIVEADGYQAWAGQVVILSTGAEYERIELEPLPQEVLDALKRREVGLIVEKANEFMIEGDWEKAREVYQDSLEEVGSEDRVPVLVGIAQTYMNEENYAEAKKILDQALALDAEYPAANRLAATVAVMNDDVAAAETYLLKVPSDDKLPPSTTMNIGIAYYNENNPEKAEYWISRTIESNPEIGICYYYRGLVMVQKANNEQAIADFEKFIEISPEDENVAQAKDFLSYLRED